MRQRSRRPLHRLFLAGGLMASALVAAPAFARPEPQPKTAPAKKPGCIQGGRQTRYVSHERRFAVDHSYLRVTWEPRFCKADGRWTTGDLPSVSLLGAGSVENIILDFEAAHYISGGIEYRARVRQCVSVSAGAFGVGTSGSGCYTVGKANFRARVAGSKVSYEWKMSTTSWFRDASRGPLKWTGRVI
jgi:hypothetical protein